MTAPFRAGPDGAASAEAPRADATRAGFLERVAAETGIGVRTISIGILLPFLALIVVIATVGVAPADQRVTIILASVVAVAAGLSSTAIGVYGGVLVPGLLLLGIDARFAAALSLFLPVLVIPLAAGSHYKMGNFSKKVALPLVIGGMIGAFIGPLFFAALSQDVIARGGGAVVGFFGAVVLAALH